LWQGIILLEDYHGLEVTGVEDLKTWIRDVITTINRGMHMGRTGISTRCSPCDTGCPHSSALSVEKTLCMYPSNKISSTFFLAIYNF
jgi:hypothetical protein